MMFYSHNCVAPPIQRIYDSKERGIRALLDYQGIIIQKSSDVKFF